MVGLVGLEVLSPSALLDKHGALEARPLYLTNPVERIHEFPWTSVHQKVSSFISSGSMDIHLHTDAS